MRQAELEDRADLVRHERPELVERERAYSDCVRKGHACDWQYEITMRLFGDDTVRRRAVNACILLLPMLELRNITLTLDRDGETQKLLDDLTLNVPPGHLLAMVGPIPRLRRSVRVDSRGGGP